MCQNEASFVVKSVSELKCWHTNRRRKRVMVLLLSQPLMLPGLLGEGRVGAESGTAGRMAEEEQQCLVLGVFPTCYLLCKGIPIYWTPHYARNAVRCFEWHITFLPPQACRIVRACVCSVVSNCLQPDGWVAHQTPLSMGFYRQEDGGRLPFPSSRDLPGPGIEPTSPSSPVLAGRFFTTTPPGKPKTVSVSLFYKWGNWAQRAGVICSKVTLILNGRPGM